MDTAPSGTHPRVEGSDSISSVVFSPDGTNFVLRTFGDLQKWDLRQPSQPIAVTEVQWFPRQMQKIVAGDFIKDQFRTAYMRNRKVVTGLYSADFVSWNPDDGTKVTHKAVSEKARVKPPDPGFDFTKRVTVAEAHPSDDIVAVVSTAALFVYAGAKQ
jgi:serine/threonine-protein phosphatase 2A regulatory subunit B